MNIRTGIGTPYPKKWPNFGTKNLHKRSNQLKRKEEMYSLTDQIRRSSRSIGANLAEAWQKRRYEANFISKLKPHTPFCRQYPK